MSDNLFYGSAPQNLIDGLDAKVLDAVHYVWREKRPPKRIHYQYLVLRDQFGSKWKIAPEFNAEGQIKRLYLWHRNECGLEGYHRQGIWAAATQKGLLRIIREVVIHEQWEKKQLFGNSK